MRRMRLPVLVFLMLPMAASAQLLTFGVQGGVPVQTPLGRTDEMPFAIGPTVNIHIGGGLSLQSGLLYDRIGRRSDTAVFLPADAVTFGASTSHGRALEVPLLAKYRFRGVRRTWRPFLSAGPSIRHTSLESDASYSTLSGIPAGSTQQSITIFHNPIRQWNVDPAAGAGVDVRAGRFHLEPEVRYSYWAAGTTGPIRKNQVNLLMGFRF
jgi:hypothetical protein